jgi:hypothetical protein
MLYYRRARFAFPDRIDGYDSFQVFVVIVIVVVEFFLEKIARPSMRVE